MLKPNIEEIAKYPKPVQSIIMRAIEVAQMNKVSITTTTAFKNAMKELTLSCSHFCEKDE